MTNKIFSLSAERRASGQSISEIAANAHEAATKHPDCFVSLLPAEQIADQAGWVTQALSEGKDLPLAGLTFCAKDNLDVAGLASTGNCPGYGKLAAENAPAVQKALDAGAVLIGKNTMDQFATGLNGTRSPEPLCRNAIDPAIIPGGSSSGSAVAVAKGICDFSFGSDTGGSGRVPAATNGIIGFKPTPGLLSGRGMVYCNRSFDVIPIFTKTVDDAAHVFTTVMGPDPLDPFGYQGSVAEPQSGMHFAIPDTLYHFGDPVAEAAHVENLARLQAHGATFSEIDFSNFAEAGELLFGSAMVAERLMDYGDFIEDNRGSVVPAVAQAIDAGRSYSARDLVAALHRLAELKLQCKAVLDGVDALVLPTIPRLFTVSEMLADPMALNSIMGTYTYFANPLGYAAIAVPGVKRTDGMPSSVCFVGPSGTDLKMIALGQMFEGLP